MAFWLTWVLPEMGSRLTWWFPSHSLRKSVLGQSTSENLRARLAQERRLGPNPELPNCYRHSSSRKATPASSGSDVSISFHLFPPGLPGSPPAIFDGIESRRLLLGYPVHPGSFPLPASPHNGLTSIQCCWSTGQQAACIGAWHGTSAAPAQA